MEKIIRVTMSQSKDIEISAPNTETIIISRDNRSIKADQLYDLLGFSTGDTYKIETSNEYKVDEEVFKFFVDLLISITEKLNTIASF